MGSTYQVELGTESGEHVHSVAVTVCPGLVGARAQRRLACRSSVNASCRAAPQAVSKSSLDLGLVNVVASDALGPLYAAVIDANFKQMSTVVVIGAVVAGMFHSLGQCL